ncbi:odorant receptor Or1-like isoform X2 [Microplitis mediator]|uniref:odorant receptor Or1-like isoform X2 n=1 Tax=Microplitis mediator TaxID=375433 RepID=UPI0025576EF8|nr:odorant receptor Or1-like isoform X2 [Microplitis mediator]
MAILKESFFVLTCIGLWRPVEWQGIKGTFYNCYTLLVILNSITFVISESMELIFFNHGIFDFFNNSSMLITIIGMCGKTITVVSNRGTIIKMIERFNGNPFSPRDYQEEIIHKNFNRMIRFNTLVYTVFFEVSVTVFTVGKIFEDRPPGVLPCRAWLPYDYSNNIIIYWVTASQQLLTIFMSANVDIAYDTLFPGMMMQVCAQLNVLKHRFRLTLDALENVSDDKMDPVMAKTVEKKFFSEMVDTMSHVFGPMIFIQYSFSSIILCSSVYALSQMVPFSPEFIACSVYILCMFFQIFVICMSGNRVTLEFAELSTAMYNTNWFALSNNAQKHIVMMMMSSIKPIVFASGHVVTLSLESFKRLLKLSYTIYNVFQQSS